MFNRSLSKKVWDLQQPSTTEKEQKVLLREVNRVLDKYEITMEEYNSDRLHTFKFRTWKQIEIDLLHRILLYFTRPRLGQVEQFDFKVERNHAKQTKEIICLLMPSEYIDVKILFNMTKGKVKEEYSEQILKNKEILSKRMDHVIDLLCTEDEIPVQHLMGSDEHTGDFSPQMNDVAEVLKKDDKINEKQDILEAIKSDSGGE